MFTTCPNCALNLAVTAADLRIGQGYVRCGRCVSVFNALISLADEAEVGPDIAPVEDRAAATQSRPVPKDLASLADLDLGLPDPALATPAKVDRPAPEPETDVTGERPQDLAEVTDESRDASTGTFETIVLEGDTILQTEEFVDESEVDEQLRALAEQLGGNEAGKTSPQTARDGDDLSLEDASPRLAPSFDDEPEDAPAVASADFAIDSLLGKPRPRPRATLWLVGALVLLVLLAAQAVHHWRQPLAARVPAIGALYGNLGMPLSPPWRLDAYEVRQLGAAADPANAQRIEVRASIRNAADREQPAPVLRVILQDRFGNEIGRHERQPADYLRGAQLAMLAADQRVDASFWIDDPEQKAVGFEIDACLRESAGAAPSALRCATDAAARP